MSNREWIERYLALGWRIVPIQPKGKEFKVRKPWAELREYPFTADDFGSDDNVGLDPSSGGLTDVDLDCPEAVALGGLFLPECGLIFGRGRKPRSHYLYLCDQDEDVKLSFASGETILELRTGSIGHTRIPPGIALCDDGTEDQLEWVKFIDGRPTAVEAKLLRRAAALVAATAAIARAYPEPHSRHDWSLALWGTLKQLGVDLEEAEKVLKGLCFVAEEPKHDDRLLDLRSTYHKGDEAAIAGLGSLRRRTPKLVQELRKFLGDTARRGNMILNKTGGVDASNPKNFISHLGGEGITLAYDAFARDKVLRQNGRQRPMIEEVVRELRFSFHDKHGVLPPKDNYYETIDRVAWQNHYHPVQDYLESLEWDGTKRVDTWLQTYCEAEDTPFAQRAGAITLIAAVRRVLEPGVKFDTMLILEGIQGSGKSTTIRELCPHVEWFSDNLPIGAEPQRVIEQTKGKWICEIAELFGLSKREIDQVKGFLSRGTDEARKVYAREPDRRPRQFISIGTTNKKSYLSDPTGNRRFWPVKVGQKQDVEGIRRDRDQLWAEAFTRREDSIVLPQALWGDAEAAQEAREQEDPWELELSMILEDPPEALVPKRGSKELIVSVQDAYGLLNVPIERQDRTTHARLSQAMERLGFEKGTYRRGTQTIKGWAKWHDL